MADLERSSGRRMTRRQRERRAYQLTLATGVLAVVAVAGIVLAAIGVVGAGLPILAVILAVVSGLLLRRTLGL
jgi:fatty acid desaturase